jgi:hypothetical protein
MSERWLWTQKQDIGPSPRLGHFMGYDPKRKRVVLFGGCVAEVPSFVYDGGTWEWDGVAWAQVADMGPSARARGAIAYDARNECFVLFGGGASLGDTWRWDGNEWSQVADIGPSARLGSRMVFDPTRQRVLLHGGADNGVLNDTWEWDGTEWQQIADTGPPRAEHALVFDNESNVLILFGGAGGNGGWGERDTWEFRDSAWVKRQDMGPNTLGTPTAVNTGRRTILFDGGVADRAGETWEWNGSLWTERQNMGPSSRRWHAMAYDRDRQRTVLFGGQWFKSGAPKLLGDTWELAILS